MAFPTTPILDTFDRANGGLGANWGSPIDPAQSTPTINTNVAIAPSSLFGSAYWSVGTFAANQECYATIPAGASAQSDFWLYNRIQNIGLGTWCDYVCVFMPGSSLVNLSFEYNAGNSGTIYSIGSLTLTAGTKVGFSTTTSGTSNIIDIYSDTGAGWTLRGSFTDTGRNVTQPLLANAGYIGFSLFGNGTTTRSLDNFGGGAQVTSTTPPPSHMIRTSRGVAW